MFTSTKTSHPTLWKSKLTFYLLVIPLAMVKTKIWYTSSNASCMLTFIERIHFYLLMTDNKIPIFCILDVDSWVSVFVAPKMINLLSITIHSTHLFIHTLMCCQWALDTINWLLTSKYYQILYKARIICFNQFCRLNFEM